MVCMEDGACVYLLVNPILTISLPFRKISTYKSEERFDYQHKIQSNHHGREQLSPGWLKLLRDFSVTSVPLRYQG